MTQLRHPHHKILAEDVVLKKLARPRTHTLIFTNGVFDILHRGHVEYLYAARELGDELIVALNTDASVRRLKGPERPINHETDRAVVLAALGCVDYVTFFGDDTPQRLIAALLPDVLVKGGDYTPANIVGRAEVEGAGGRVVVIPFVHGRSTTETVNKIKLL
jgi:D-beta-D-heptose 7-phosphate kinase/D-beta-D-heptose 1-phosphate adenosyltransferase